MRLVNDAAAVADQAAVQIGDGALRSRALRIGAGAYSTPFWIESADGGLLVRVDALPWQGVIPVGDVQIHSTEPAKPNTPSVTASSPTATGVTLDTSAFSDPNPGDSHLASQYQIALASDPTFSSPVYDSGEDPTNLTQLVVSGVLSAETNYIARVRHKDAPP